MSRKQLRRKLKFKARRNRHHLIPRARGGSDENWNLLLIKIERHNTWHQVFGLRTLDEVLDLLHRLKRMKDRQRLIAA